MKGALLTVTWMFIGHFLFGQETVLREKVPLQPYFRYSVIAPGQDTITYYLSEFDRDVAMPLVVYIQGSGYQSLFSHDGNNIQPRFGHITLAYSLKGKAKLLLVEKPGVHYLDDRSPNPDFDRTFSLATWSRRIEAAIQLILHQEKVASDKVMLIGHSEGGLVAARVAADLNASISHVALLAGEGPTQLYSLYRLIEQHSLPDVPDWSDPNRTESLLTTWKAIQADPTSTTRKFWGFTYLRWSSFLSTSTYDELMKFNGKIFIVQGEEDKNVVPESAKVLYAGLLSKGKNVSLEMIPAADHSFQLPNESQGWERVGEKVIEWFVR